MSRAIKLIVITFLLLANLPSARAEEHCADLLNGQSSIASNTASFVALVKQVVDKAGAKADELFLAIERSAEPLNPTVIINASAGLSAAEAHVFRLAFAKTMRQAGIDWESVKETVRIMAREADKTRAESKKAKTETARIFHFTNRPIPAAIEGGSRVVHFESSNGTRYFAATKFTRMPAYTTTVVNLNTGKTFSVSRGPLDIGDPAFVELASGNVRFFVSERRAIGVYDADTGEPKVRIDLDENIFEIERTGTREGSPNITEILPYFTAEGSLQLIVNWQRPIFPNCYRSDTYSKIDIKTETAKLHSFQDQTEYAKSGDGKAVYAVTKSSIRTNDDQSGYAITVTDLASNKTIIDSRAFLNTADHPYVTVQFSKMTTQPFLTVKFDSGLTVFDLRTGTEKTFPIAKNESSFIGFFEDERLNTFALFYPTVTPNRQEFWAINLQSGERKHIANVPNLAHTSADWFVVRSKLIGPVLLWPQTSTDAYALELLTGKVHVLQDPTETAFHLAYGLADGRIEVIKSDSGRTTIYQAFGPIPSATGD